MRQTVIRFPGFRIVSRVFLAAAVAGTVAMSGAAPAQASSKNDASIVVDANTGKVLFAENPDAPRYPASLTKMMTLYLVFDALTAGKISLQTKMPVSKKASDQAPSKLGLRPGQTLTVEAAILSLVTKSANDAAMVVGEFLGGSEANFAQMMTNKARRLGMKNTVFRNPNGLPDLAQKTTARDMATLGLALRSNHGRYYSYFSTRSYTFAGRKMANHNKLLGRVQGVDGIKTGYTRLSGFNLVSSVTLGGKRIVAVVMGGESGRSRDDEMAGLIRAYLPKASTRAGSELIAAVAPADAVDPASAAAIELPRAAAPMPAERPTAVAAYADEDAAEEQGSAAIDPVATASTPVLKLPAKAQVKAAAIVPPSAPRSGAGWVIQVASTGSETDAQAVLSRTTKQAGQLLADVSAFTETFSKGGTVYYRARFGGFSSKADAFSTCGALKKRNISCYATQQ